MEIIKVKSSKNYSIYVGNNIICTVGTYLSQLKPLCKVLVVTDDVVDKLYFDKIKRSLTDCGYTVEKFVFPNGENSKSLETYGEILDKLAEKSFTRTDVIVALGGGVVGDLAGFVASSYMRGIDFVQVPTTILSQIDSSVGGKTAVNLPMGKNLVGAFYQPIFVLCDIETTKTLTEEIFNDGMGEMSKYGVLIGENFAELLEQDNLKENLFQLIVKCIEYKRDVVERDEFESGERKLLNLGHTVAHGIEKLSNYTISHGKAVGMGMKIIISACYKNHLISKDEFQRMNGLLNLCNQRSNCPFTIFELVETFTLDKKCTGDTITLILTEGIGKCVLKKVKIEDVLEILS